jgi:threonine aldolase
MRQAGIIAAGGVYALRHHVDRLADDHANARLLAGGLAAIPGIRLLHDPIETNIVFFDVTETGLTAGELEHRLNEQGVRMDGYGSETVIRAVTHIDVSREDCERAVEAVRLSCQAPVSVG